MHAPEENARETTLRQLTELPAVDEVVWAIVSRFHSSKSAARLYFVAPTARAGTTTIATAAALALAAQQHDPVCLVEANVEHPSLSRLLGLRPAGLTESLEQGADPTSFLQGVPGCPRLDVLTAGARRELGSGALTATIWSSVLEALGKSHRYVVVDAPPILEHMKSRLMLQQSDGAVLVLHTNSTSRDEADRAHRMVTEAGVPALGVVFNNYRTGRWRSRAERARDARAKELAPATGTQGIGVPRMIPIPAPGDALHAAAHKSIVLRRKLALSVKPVHAVGGHVDGDARPEVELLERRIAKLVAQLTETEEKLVRISRMKDVDPGLASIYREAQGIDAADRARAHKTALLEKIFVANQELQQAIARHKRDPQGGGFRMATSGDA